MLVLVPREGVGEGRFDSLLTLLEESEDENFYSLLSGILLSVQNGSLECSALLVNQVPGAQLVNAVDLTGRAALHYAAAAGHAAVIRQLASVPGCELEIEDHNDR